MVKIRPSMKPGELPREASHGYHPPRGGMGAFGDEPGTGSRRFTISTAGNPRGGPHNRRTMCSVLRPLPEERVPNTVNENSKEGSEVSSSVDIGESMVARGIRAILGKSNRRRSVLQDVFTSGVGSGGKKTAASTVESGGQERGDADGYRPLAASGQDGEGNRAPRGRFAQVVSPPTSEEDGDGDGISNRRSSLGVSAPLLRKPGGRKTAPASAYVDVADGGIHSTSAAAVLGSGAARRASARGSISHHEREELAKKFQLQASDNLTTFSEAKRLQISEVATIIENTDDVTRVGGRVMSSPACSSEGGGRSPKGASVRERKAQSGKLPTGALVI